jgi:hypothetical protein
MLLLLALIVNANVTARASCITTRPTPDFATIIAKERITFGICVFKKTHPDKHGQDAPQTYNEDQWDYQKDGKAGDCRQVEENSFLAGVCNVTFIHKAPQ